MPSEQGVGSVYNSIPEIEADDSPGLSCGGYNCREVFRPSYHLVSSLRKAVAGEETSFKKGTPCPGRRLGAAHKGQKRQSYSCQSGWYWEGTIEYHPEPLGEEVPEAET